MTIEKQIKFQKKWDNKQNFIINNGDRIAQMILSPILKMELEETDNLPDTVRGEGGFGSTGK